MKERGLIFSGPMVRANLDGRKSQTRRVIKPQPRNYLFWSDGFQKWYDNKATTTYDMIGRKCPYGVPGDRFYMRENLLLQRESGTKYFDVLYEADNTHVDNGHELDEWFMNYTGWYNSGKSKRIIPCIHMPKYVARPERFEITDIRVERVQDISEEDAIAEGMTTERTDEYLQGRCLDNCAESHCDYIGDKDLCDIYHTDADCRETEAFGILWDSINAKRGICKVCKGFQKVSGWAGSLSDNSLMQTAEDCPNCDGPTGYGWDINPWCWCISYRKL